MEAAISHCPPICQVSRKTSALPTSWVIANTQAFITADSPYDIREKAERRADKWAFCKLTPYGQIKEAVSHGITEPFWELADYFDAALQLHAARRGVLSDSDRINEDMAACH